jgi:hypothetical protein
MILAVIGSTVAALLLVACGQTEATSTTVVSTDTSATEAYTEPSTPGLPTSTSTPIPSDTPVPPSPTATATSTSTPTPAPTATPIAGMGVPVAGGPWQVTVEDVYTTTRLSGGLGHGTTHTTKDGYTFLVVEAMFHNLNPAQQSELSTEEGAIINEDGESLAAVGGGSGSSYCAGCVTTWATGEGQKGFVFVLEEEAVDQVYKFQFRDVPLIPFSVEEAEYPLTTEVSDERGALPPACEAETLRSLGDTARLAVQRWEETGLVLAVTAPDGSDATPVCTGLAVGDLQLAPDGATLLQLGPRQGWPSLYLVESNRKVYPLVKNGQDIEAQFDPSGRWVLFTTRQLGEVEERLYVFDRETDSTSLVKEGTGVAFRFLADGRLLVKHRISEDSDPQFELGLPDGNALEPLDLPSNVLESEHLEVSDDGEHIVYVERDEAQDRHLFVANLDGGDPQELAETEHWGLQGVLSPDDQFILIEIDEGYDVGRKAELRNLVNGESLTIVTEVDRLDFDFSPDSQWALAFSAVRGPDWDSEDQHTLYVVHTVDSSIREIADAVNAFSSPDSTQLAYTVRQPDGNLEMYVTSLVDEAVRSLGPGVLTGWFPPGTAP